MGEDQGRAWLGWAWCLMQCFPGRVGVFKAQEVAGSFCEGVRGKQSVVELVKEEIDWTQWRGGGPR